MCAPRDRRKSNNNQRQQAELDTLRCQRRAIFERRVEGLAPNCRSRTLQGPQFAEGQLWDDRLWRGAKRSSSLATPKLSAAVAIARKLPSNLMPWRAGASKP